MITYRSSEEFEERFGSGVDAEGYGAVDRYLAARGEAYTNVMAPLRWLSLSEAIDRFAVDPAAIETPTTLVACPTDQIAPFTEMKALAARLPNLRALHELPSLYGHDSFLKEPRTLAPLIRQFLKEPLHG
jgi:homoserine O-acetyltransferase